MQAWEQQVQPAAALPKPPGLELKVTFDGAVADTQAAYAALTQGLGGLLCTSVAMAPQLAVMAAPRVGWFSHQAPAVAAAASPATDEQRQAQQLRQQVYAWLPQVSVCSENLAAWRRLLPCREQAGLAASFHPLQLAAAPYYSLGLRLQVAPAPGGAAAGGSCSSADCGGAWLELRQVLTAALPRPNQQTQPASLFEAVFGGPPPPPCPAATSSTVYVARPATAVLPSLEGGGSSLHDTPAGQLVAWDARQQQEQLPASLLGSSSSSSEGGTFTAQQRPLQVVQHAVQHSSQAGTLVVGVRVSGAALAQQESGSALLHVMQLLPWQLLVDAASFEVKLDGQVGWC